MSTSCGTNIVFPKSSEWPVQELVIIDAFQEVFLAPVFKQPDCCISNWQGGEIEGRIMFISTGDKDGHAGVSGTLALIWTSSDDGCVHSLEYDFAYADISDGVKWSEICQLNRVRARKQVVWSGVRKYGFGIRTDVRPGVGGQ
jgi:hypothetical protein